MLSENRKKVIGQGKIAFPKGTENGSNADTAYEMSHWIQIVAVILSIRQING